MITQEQINKWVNEHTTADPCKGMPSKIVYKLMLQAPYWGAGSKYSWDYEDDVGFGIDEQILKYNDEVWIFYNTKGQGMNHYILEDTKQVIPYKELHKGINLRIIPRAICKKI